MIGRLLAQPMIWFVKAWRRVISPAYGDVCKFHPSCSAYGLRALEVHGAFRGTALLVSRLGRCHPWSEGGVDYVPGTDEARDWAAGHPPHTVDQPSGPARSTTEVAS